MQLLSIALHINPFIHPSIFPTFSLRELKSHSSNVRAFSYSSVARMFSLSSSFPLVQLIDESSSGVEASENACPPPIGWPRNGTVEFCHVSLSYGPSLPLVLKDVSFQIKSGEKVGWLVGWLVGGWSVR